MKTIGPNLGVIRIHPNIDEYPSEKTNKSFIKNILHISHKKTMKKYFFLKFIDKLCNVSFDDFTSNFKTLNLAVLKKPC